MALYLFNDHKPLEDIKIYPHVNPNDERVSFRISRMEDYTHKRQESTEEPHRHDFYTVLITKEAKGIHSIDFNAYELSNNQIFFISPGQVHQLIEYQPPKGYVIVFTKDFLLNNSISDYLISDLNLFNSYSNRPPLDATTIFPIIKRFCEEMLTLYRTQNLKYQYQSIGAYLKLLLIQCNNSCTCKEEHTQLTEAGTSKLKQFKDLLEKQFKDWHSVGQYADALNVTSDHLNRVVKSLTGKSSKEHIQDRIVVAAKRMLYFSSASAKEIAYDLGFGEPAHFSQFFKKKIGVSPSQFRAQRHAHSE